MVETVEALYIKFWWFVYGHCCAAKPPVPVDRSVGFDCTPKGEQILNELGEVGGAMLGRRKESKKEERIRWIRII